MALFLLLSTAQAQQVDVSTATRFSPKGVYADGEDIYMADGFYIRKVSGGKVSDVTPTDPNGCQYFFNAYSITNGDDNWSASNGCSINKMESGHNRI